LKGAVTGAALLDSAQETQARSLSVPRACRYKKNPSIASENAVYKKRAHGKMEREKEGGRGRMTLMDRVAQ